METAARGVVAFLIGGAGGPAIRNPLLARTARRVAQRPDGAPAGRHLN